MTTSVDQSLGREAPLGRRVDLLDVMVRSMVGWREGFLRTSFVFSSDGNSDVNSTTELVNSSSDPVNKSSFDKVVCLEGMTPMRMTGSGASMGVLLEEERRCISSNEANSAGSLEEVVRPVNPVMVLAVATR